MTLDFQAMRNLFTGMILGIVVTLGTTVFAENVHDADENASLPLDQLRIFASIFGIIKEEYVEPVDDVDLLNDAIRGMLAGLDPHSSYLVGEDYINLQEGSSGEFGGLGLEVGMENGFIKVISPIDDTPADRAGVKAGDLIVRIDGKPVKGLNLDESVASMRGEPGSEIVLTIVREGQDKPLKLTIVRAIIKIASVRGRVLEEGFIYLRIAQFQTRTTADMYQKIEQLKKETGGEIKGMVLDLRNNPGGILNAAVAVSDAFLTEGLVVYTQGRREGSRQDFRAGPDDILNGAPLIVLVNEGSASASEIVAGALQDKKRGLIMGTPTFGKGSVQSVVPVGIGNAAIKLTTALYYTPSGRSIQAEGIQPDILITPVKLSAIDEKHRIAAIKERDLKGHLSNTQKKDKKSANKDKNKDEDEDEDEKPLIEKDYALNEALNLLKGLAILGAHKN